RFAYIQIKKTGGGGTADRDEIRAHAEKYADVLSAQVTLYQPHLVLGCGVGGDSPARLLAAHVLAGDAPQRTRVTRAEWWRFEAPSRPLAMIQLWHPARRGSRRVTYRDVWASVREVVGTLIR